MDIEAGIFNFLQDAVKAAPLIALVGTRIYPERAQYSEQFPYITFTSDEVDVHGHLVSPSTLAQYIFTFDIHAATTDSRTAVREALRNCLDGRIDLAVSLSGETVRIKSVRRMGQTQSDDPPPDGKEDGGCFVCSVDYLVTFSQPAPTLP